MIAAATTAAAQTLSLDLGQGGGVTERALQLIALITLLSLAPSVLIMVTSFTRIVVVLSLLRSAIGTQTAPPNTVLIALAIFLTAFIMQPTFTEAYTTAVRPAIDNQITLEQAFERAQRHSRPSWSSMSAKRILHCSSTCRASHGPRRWRT